MKAYDDWKSVIGLKPAPRNGRAIFKQHCGVCHRLDREGVNVGPDLFGIRNQPKEAILLHVIVPEHEIAPGFTAYEVETKDGRTLTGLIVADTPAAVTIRGGQGQEDTIARSNIASMSSHGLSLMPQEMEKNMSRQDMADLLAFLKGEQDR
jgi:putative heme-binding domain-containing protein